MIAICREMTKLHEEIIRGSLKDVLESIETNKVVLRGEIVLVIAGSQKNQTDFSFNLKVKNEFLKKLSASDAAKLISLITGQNKRDIYKYLIES
jgi:16S rRNA (cytidine1402-2'-O)-methyltransferase